MIAYTFFGPVPSKKNGKRSVQRGSKKFWIPSAAYESWERAERAKLIATIGKLNLKSFAIEISPFFANNAVRDTDNVLTSIQDCLKAAGVIADDRWQFMLRPPQIHQPQIDRENPRVELLIKLAE